jgi:predicted AlkP superfamily pyrophosphatase or phosphodiesterase
VPARESDALTLIFVFDGLRPDFVRPDWTPVLWELRGRGVWAAHSHCVFPAVTRANAASLASGCFPGRHGIESNTIWRPEVEPSRPLRTADRADLLRLEAAQGRLLAPLTLGEALAAVGERVAAVGTGSAGAASLLHPQARQTDGLMLHYGFSVPESLGDEVAAVLGAWPASGGGLTPGELAAARVDYGVRALGEVVLPRARPGAAFFWCTIPDGPHHRHGLGHPESVAALRQADAAFGRLLEAVRRLYQAVNVIVTSDHGYVTVSGRFDVAAALRDGGFLPDGDTPAAII